MFVIMVYDVEVKRVNKVLKTARKYLYWVQNSVLEGNINESSYKRLKMELSRIIDPEYDSIIFYTFRTTKYSGTGDHGSRKRGRDPVPVVGGGRGTICDFAAWNCCLAVNRTIDWLHFWVLLFGGIRKYLKRNYIAPRNMESAQYVRLETAAYIPIFLRADGILLPVKRSNPGYPSLMF